MAHSPPPIGSISAPALVPSPIHPTPTMNDNESPTIKSIQYVSEARPTAGESPPQPSLCVRACVPSACCASQLSLTAIHPAALCSALSLRHQQHPTPNSRYCSPAPSPAQPSPAQPGGCSQPQRRRPGSWRPNQGFLSNDSGDPRIMSGPSQRLSVLCGPAVFFIHREFATFPWPCPQSGPPSCLPLSKSLQLYLRLLHQKSSMSPSHALAHVHCPGQCRRPQP